MVNYGRWDLVDQLTVAQASCLWVDLEPTISFLHQKSQHPEIVAIEQMLVSEIRAERLPADSSSNALSFIGDLSQSLVFREGLIDLAKRKGVEPRFLFPDARSLPEGSQKSAVRENEAWIA